LIYKFTYVTLNDVEDMITTSYCQIAQKI